MNLKKRCKVVLVSTNKKAQKNELFIYPNGRLGLCAISNSCSFTGYNLTVISDDKVEVGDFILLNDSNCSKTMKIKSLIGSDLEKDFKKIIATTDRLSFYIDGLKMTPLNRILPTPSSQFIQKFISEYNKGNIISEVDVEYEGGYYTFNNQIIYTLFKEISEISGRESLFNNSASIVTFTGYGSKGELICKNEKMENLVQNYIPKVDKENNISIFKIKDSWNREEVMKLIEDAIMTTYNIPLNDPKRSELVNKWIEENL